MPPDVVRVMRTVEVPAAGAVTVIAWVAGCGSPQEAAFEPCAPAGATRARVPDDGDTVGPPATGATCQWTETAPVAAGAIPISTDVGCPATTVAAPLGEEKPTAGSAAVPGDGGLSAGEEPHAGSGELERVSWRVPPVSRTDAGSHGRSQVPGVEGAGTELAQAAPDAPEAGRDTPVTVRAWT